MEEVAKAFFRQEVRISCIHVLLLVGDFSTPLPAGITADFPKYFAVNYFKFFSFVHMKVVSCMLSQNMFSFKIVWLGDRD